MPKLLKLILCFVFFLSFTIFLLYFVIYRIENVIENKSILQIYCSWIVITVLILYLLIYEIYEELVNIGLIKPYSMFATMAVSPMASPIDDLGKGSSNKRARNSDSDSDSEDLEPTPKKPKLEVPPLVICTSNNPSAPITSENSIVVEFSSDFEEASSQKLSALINVIDTINTSWFDSHKNIKEEISKLESDQLIDEDPVDRAVLGTLIAIDNNRDSTLEFSETNSQLKPKIVDWSDHPYKKIGGWETRENWLRIQNNGSFPSLAADSESESGSESENEED